MSIVDEINKLKQTLIASYSILASKGVTLPEDKNYDNLPVYLDRVHTEVKNAPLTIAPSTTEQTFVAPPEFSGYNTIVADAVTAAIDSSIKPENILKGTTILEVRGSVVLDETTISPSTTERTIVHEGVGGYSTIVVDPVTAAIDPDIIAANIREGIEILGVEGTVIEASTHAITFTENGTYVPEEGYNGFSEVEVNVEDISPTYMGYLDEIETVMEEYSIPVTGEYSLLANDLDTYLGDLSEDLETIVAGGTSDPSFTVLVGQTATFTENGTYAPEIGYNGFTNVVVDVNEYVDPVLEDITVTANGTYSAGSGYDGLGNVEVNVEGHDETVLQDKTLEVDATTATETVIEPDSGYDGLSSVTVDLSYFPVNYGANREISAQGVYQMPAQNFVFSLPSNAKKLDSYSLRNAFYSCSSLTSVDLSSLTNMNGVEAMYHAFNSCTNLTSVDLSSLTSIYGINVMQYAFEGCTGLTSVDLSNLTTINGSSVMYYVFRNCTSLTSLSFPRLTTIGASDALYCIIDGCTSLTSLSFPSLTTVSGDSAMRYAFSGCTSLASIDLSSLSTLSNNQAMYGAFSGCTSITNLSFPALNSNSFGSYTNQFSKMLQGVTGCTVHFPSNLQSVIGSWSDVTAGFGGTNTTVLFDLPATT